MPELALPRLREIPPPIGFSAPPAAPAYAELAVASNFSFLRGASHPDELIVRAAELGYRAIAVTDLNTLAGAVRMHSAAKEVGMKFVVGSRLEFSDHDPLLVWPEDRAAYARLCRLLTLGKRRTEKGKCDLAIADFLQHSQGIHAALVPLEDSTAADLQQRLNALKSILADRLSLAAICTLESDDQSRLQRLDAISHQSAVPLLATNDVHYHVPTRRRLQDILTCVRHGCTIQDAGLRLFANGERYLKSPAQMQAIFSRHSRAIRRGLEIAERCAFSLGELRYEYPRHLSPDGTTPLKYLAQLAWSGAAGRYPNGIPEKVRRLIEHELQLIESLKIEAYFLTVYDLVRFARERGILCQGRGSAANSAVCYCIGVTSVDPARIDTLFERFVSAARDEPPDIDVDFEHERREEVLQFLYEKYGRERAGMTAEVISYRGRSAVRDVAKAMGMGLDMVDRMAKRLDWWDHGKLTEDKLREVGLDPRDRTVGLIIELCAELLGFPRHLGQHVGGMVMTRGLLCEMVPIENASMPDRTVIEWDKDDIDELGILKVDVLSLGMLTCISKSLKMIDPPLELHEIPAEDAAVYEMISDADTVGVFQIESRAQMTMLPRLRPRVFYDLVIEVAIVRPGPIQGDMVHPYLRRRNGEEAVTYPSEAMKEVLHKTLGVPLFQEQAMRVAMVGAGFSAEEADRFRRAMAGWRRGGAIEGFQKKIIDGMIANGYTAAYAEQCFNQLKGFGEYGFPESHAASFALLAYASAWLKRHHPAEFCCGLLNSQPMGFYAPAQLVRDAQMHGVCVLPADVNHSRWDCMLCDEPDPLPPSPVEVKWNWGRGRKAVRLGLRLIKGLSQTHAEQLVRAREKGGAFRSIRHISQATGLTFAPLTRLADADAMRSLGLSRRQAMWEVLAWRDDDPPFSLWDQCDSPPEPAVALPGMSPPQEVAADYRTAGLSLRDHPVRFIRRELKSRGIIPASELERMPPGKWVSVAGMVLIRQRPGTASGIVFETIEDESGVANLIIRPEVFDRCRLAARHASLVRADGYVERQGKVVHLMTVYMEDLTELLGYASSSRDFR